MRGVPGVQEAVDRLRGVPARTQLSVVAVSYEVYKLTGSNLDVGLISLFQLLPAMLGSILGGSIADAIDRKRLLLVTGTIMAAVFDWASPRHRPRASLVGPALRAGCSECRLPGR